MAKRLPERIRTDLEQKAWLLKSKFWTEERIATELGVDQSTVNRMLQRVEARLVAEFTEKALAIKIQQTDRLEFLASEAIEAWEKSKRPGDKERTVTKRLGAKPKAERPSVPEGPDEVPGMYLDADEAIEDAGEITDEDRARLLSVMGMNADGSGLTIVEQATTHERKYQVGDPRFLEQARGALSDIRGIWGAEAPKKAELGGNLTLTPIIGYEVVPPGNAVVENGGTGREDATGQDTL